VGNRVDRIKDNLRELQQATNADFVAIAWMEHAERFLKWKFVLGNRNERFKRIVLSNSKGIIGKVFRSGRPFIIHSFCPEEGVDPAEFSILLAEGLQSLAAVPIASSTQIQGVILLGCRYPRQYDAEVCQAENVAMEILDLLHLQL